jgi:VWFA-related protein
MSLQQIFRGKQASLALIFGLAFAGSARSALTQTVLDTPVAASANAPITLNVVVSGKGGVPVSDLKQQDFTLLVDKKPTPIASFKAVEAPVAAGRGTVAHGDVEVILLVDSVNTRFSHVAYERQEIQKFLKSNDGVLPRPVSLVLLSDTDLKIEPVPSRDGNALSDILEKSEIGLRQIRRSAGFDGAVERFEISARALKQIATYEATRPGRKLLVWISPGWPLLSGPGVNLSKKESLGLFHTAVDLSNSLTRAGITLSSVDPLGVDESLVRSSYYKAFLDGVPDASKMEAGNLALQVLAAQSGGRVFSSSNDIARGIADAVSDAQSFYVLTFQPPPADHPDQYRSVSVNVNNPGLAARTRTGFYSQP